MASKLMCQQQCDKTWPAALFKQQYASSNVAIWPARVLVSLSAGSPQDLLATGGPMSEPTLAAVAKGDPSRASAVLAAAAAWGGRAWGDRCAAHHPRRSLYLPWCGGGWWCLWEWSCVPTHERTGDHNKTRAGGRAGGRQAS